MSESAPAAAAPGPAGEAPPAQGVLDGLSAIFAAARQTLSDFLELLSLEVRHAGLTLMWMMAWGAVATVLVVAAWVGIMAALALWLVSLGISWLPVLIGIAAVNLLAAAGLMVFCIRMSRNLLLLVTRRQLAAKLRVG